MQRHLSAHTLVRLVTGTACAACGQFSAVFVSGCIDESDGKDTLIDATVITHEIVSSPSVTVSGKSTATLAISIGNGYTRSHGYRECIFHVESTDPFTNSSRYSGMCLI